MKNINWYKVGVFVLLGVLLFLLVRGCGKGGGTFFSCNKADTISVKKDTVVTYVKGDTVYVPEIIGVTNTIYKDKWYTVHDTLETFETIIKPADTAKILKDYYATRFYSDTQKLVRGNVIISDSVTRNRITSRRLQSFGTDTTITNTITLTAPKRIILFFGVNAIGSLKDPFHMAGVDLTLKGKNDRMFSVGANIDQHGTLYGIFGYKIPIRLTKKR